MSTISEAIIAANAATIQAYYDDESPNQVVTLDEKGFLQLGTAAADKKITTIGVHLKNVELLMDCQADSPATVRKIIDAADQALGHIASHNKRLTCGMVVRDTTGEDCVLVERGQSFSGVDPDREFPVFVPKAVFSMRAVVQRVFA